jgi:hypothetical protein
MDIGLQSMYFIVIPTKVGILRLFSINQTPLDSVSDRKGLHRGIYVLKHIIHTRKH